MSLTGFPGSHTTSTTTKVTPLVWFDSSYLKTTPGLLKAIAVGVNILGFICASVGKKASAAPITFFSVVSMFAFWITLILLCLYLFHIIEKLHTFPWLLAEFFYCLLWSVMYLIASIVICVQGGVYAAAGFFGFLAMSLYSMDAFLKYKAHKNGEIAQGERTTTTNPVTNT
ncbi:MARVEL domain-containing protein 1-like protein [Leptotrombidium deliense]|uniref:MARVEL domain-containing protein 1-like protein n=1 Tax=Leptotrombidium deliense TaxID=299467 RepID=A0A443SPF0_9ACAR|nr:MARVEL domain-containing protein 1-like protein [Leptotrombidium deliense]